MSVCVFAIIPKNPTLFSFDENMQQEYACVTRPNQPGLFGFPGGKVEEGENMYTALIRECKEEGWLIEREHIQDVVYRDTVEGNDAIWFYVTHATQLDEYKEKHRLKTTWAAIGSMKDDPYKNKLALKEFSDTRVLKGFY